MSGSPGTGGSNPRKFSEKIALHNQKQAEETRAFEQLMTDLTVSRVNTLNVQLIVALFCTNAFIVFKDKAVFFHSDWAGWSESDGLPLLTQMSGILVTFTPLHSTRVNPMCCKYIDGQCNKNDCKKEVPKLKLAKINRNSIHNPIFNINSAIPV